MKTNWKYISLFVVLSIGISAPIHLGYFDKFYHELAGTWLAKDWVYVLAGIGPFLAGIGILLLHKTVSHRITIWGEEKVKNVLVGFLPVLSFSITGLENHHGLNIHFYGFVYAFINLIYAFMEEFGWRRYLQNALECVNKHWKYIIIGIIWWIWHLRFQTQFDFYIFPFICIGGGYFLGKLVDDTKSIMPVVTLHTLIILLTNSGAVSNHKWIGIGLTFCGWLIIELIWRKTNRGNENSAHATERVRNKEDGF